jgi:hypothetical protein
MLWGMGQRMGTAIVLDVYGGMIIVYGGLIIMKRRMRIVQRRVSVVKRRVGVVKSRVRRVTIVESMSSIKGGLVMERRV